LPLWTPSQIPLGAVGYHEKPSGRFVTLFDAFRPDGRARDLPSLLGYGNVSMGSQRYDKRSIAQVGSDFFQSFIPSKNTAPPTVSRRYTSPLRAGHKCAHLFTEVAVYRYMDDLATPKHWFKMYVDKILELYGAEHQLVRENLYLVIGTLEAQEYALFVSHSHPDGLVRFNVHSGRRPGQPWGAFEAIDAYHMIPRPHAGGLGSSQHSAMSGPVYEEPVASVVSASKVSQSARGGNEAWPAVLLARLRFKTDATEPTSL